MIDKVTDGLDVYVVGGAVRDALLGKPAGDRDWVVVGADPEMMVARGFVPVGGDFPVFLHPQSREEYALARTERKSGRGYRGFTFYTGPDVTLEDDLARRDLTINAMARSRDGALIDPLNGRADVQARVLRHVGQAFVEDPVRLLRLARFAARFHDFSIAPETLSLARTLVQRGEVDALVPERVWQELAKGLMTQEPARMLDVLADTGALPRVLPGLVWSARESAAELACAARRDLPLASRFALLCRFSAEPAAIGVHVRAPVECQDYARLLPRLVEATRHDSTQVSAACALTLFMQCDVLRKPQRMQALLDAVECVQAIDRDGWQDLVEAARGVDAGAIAQRFPGQPEQIRQAVHDARLEALAALSGRHADGARPS